MNPKAHEKLDLIGIIIIYLFTSLYALSVIFTWINLGSLETEESISLVIVMISFLLTFLYHINIIKNHIFIGVMGLFTGMIIGGLLILIAGQSSYKKTTSSH